MGKEVGDAFDGFEKSLEEVLKRIPSVSSALHQSNYDSETIRISSINPSVDMSGVAFSPQEISLNISSRYCYVTNRGYFLAIDSEEFFSDSPARIYYIRNAGMDSFTTFNADYIGGKE